MLYISKTRLCTCCTCCEQGRSGVSKHGQFLSIRFQNIIKIVDILFFLNPLPAKLIKLNFHPREVVYR